MDQIAQSRLLEQLDTPMRPPLPDPVVVETAWERLTRQALSSSIPFYARSFSDAAKPRCGLTEHPQAPATADDTPSLPALPSDTTAIRLNSADGHADVYFDVSMDLSDDALQEEVLGKMKMLAISDQELRSILMQRDPRHIPHLLDYVAMRPEPVRLAFVARELGGFADPIVIDTLSTLLAHADARVAIGALQGLAKIGGPQAILRIATMLQAETPMVSAEARTALNSFGPREILKALLTLPSVSDEQVRLAGIFLLSRMRGKEVVRLLMELLYDVSPQVRRKVILAMAFQKDPVFLPGLREFFRRTADEEDRKFARKGIVYLQGFARSPVVSATVAATTVATPQHPGLRSPAPHQENDQHHRP